MATLKIENKNLVVKLSRWERLGAMHRDVVLPLSTIDHVAVSEEPWAELQGVRAPGTGIPGVIMLGTLRHDRQRSFCAVYRKQPAIVVTTSDASFSKLVISDRNAAATAAELNSQLQTE